MGGFQLAKNAFYLSILSLRHQEISKENFKGKKRKTLKDMKKRRKAENKIIPQFLILKHSSNIHKYT